ncbi:MAG TPA: hypothetical protein VKK79_16770 [Candidatus Lokiarchaeia archaeon]|nr:hypothetical protein [Candidatus Lokiarchaeia archaeon]
MPDYDRYSQEELAKIAKFNIAQDVMSIHILHRDTFDVVFKFTSKMKRVDEDLVEKAIEQAKQLDIIYGESKFATEENFTIIYTEGNYSRLILILRTAEISEFGQKFLPGVLKELVEEFENHYYEILKKWREKQDYKAFKGADEVLDKVIGMKLNLPHQAKYQGFTPESLTEKTVFEAADAITRKLGYFYLGNLIFLTKKYVIDKEGEKQRYNEFAGAGKKGKGKEKKKKGKEKDERKTSEPEALENSTNVQFPPDEDFYIAIFNLRKRGLLQPINVEELDSFSKIQYKR